MLLRILATGALALGLAGCDAVPSLTEKTDEPLPPASAIDGADLNDLMLTMADPNAAVEYFRRMLGKEPDRLEFRRGYAQSLSRAGKPAEAALAYKQLVTENLANDEDRLGYAEALANANAWDEVEKQIGLIPDIQGSYRVSLLRAMYADQKADWAGADRNYEAARRLTTSPARVLNNWGVSKMSRKDYAGAETALEQAISFDPKMFSAKNNLVITRGLQKKYTLPVIPMNDEERAQLLHNLAVIALRQGDTPVAKSLMQEAVDTHPRHFEAAVEKLAALNQTVKKN